MYLFYLDLTSIGQKTVAEVPEPGLFLNGLTVLNISIVKNSTVITQQRSNGLAQTCVGNGQPPSQEVEGSVGGVGHVARQCLEVGLSRQPAHKLGRVGVELAVVHGV